MLNDSLARLVLYVTICTVGSESISIRWARDVPDQRREVAVYWYDIGVVEVSTCNSAALGDKANNHDLLFVTSFVNT